MKIDRLRLKYWWLDESPERGFPPIYKLEVTNCDLKLDQNPSEGNDDQ